MQEVPKLGKVLHATASSVSASEVVLSDGTSLPFDYLVLASGSTWTDPVCSGTEASLTERRLAQQACQMPLNRTAHKSVDMSLQFSLFAPSAVEPIVSLRVVYQWHILYR